MLTTYKDWQTGKQVISTPWESRLGHEACKGLPSYARWVNEDFESSVTRCSDTDFEYEIPVKVEFSIEPAQRGGWSDPSWDAYVDELFAYQYRPGKGWIELDLTESEEDQLKDEAMSIYNRRGEP
jgi:hypothetical protein